MGRYNILYSNIIHIQSIQSNTKYYIVDTNYVQYVLDITEHTISNTNIETKNIHITNLRTFVIYATVNTGLFSISMDTVIADIYRHTNSIIHTHILVINAVISFSPFFSVKTTRYELYNRIPSMDNIGYY